MQRYRKRRRRRRKFVFWIKNRFDENYSALSLLTNGLVFLTFFFLKIMKPRTHDECRFLICACCGYKNLKCAKITDHLEQLVRDHVYKEYNTENTSYPLGLCPSCRKSLYIAQKKGRDAVSQKILESWNLNLFEFRAPGRKDPCDCRVCATVRIGDKRFGEAADKELPRKSGDEANDEVVQETNAEVVPVIFSVETF